MNILLRVTFPSSEIFKTIECFTSRELANRADYIKEVASFTHATAAGYEAFFIFDVPDARITDYLKAQTERDLHLQKQIANFNVEYRIGLSVPDSIQLVVGVQRPS